MLKIFESNTSKKGQKIEFGFKYSIANLLLLTVAALMSYMPAYLMQQPMQEIVGNNSNTTIQNLNLVGALLSNPIYGLITCFIIIAYSVICILIYKEQKNSIKSTPQLEEKNLHESVNHEIIFAVKNKNSNLVSQLLKNGKSANIQDENGATLISIAINNNDAITMQLLRAYGAKD
jgi:ankyrin repeat protein